MRTKRYTDEDIINNAAKVKTLGGLLRSLGLQPKGGNYANMKANLQRLNVDTDHWLGNAWNLGARKKDWSEYRKFASIRPHILAKRGEKCERCYIEDWNGLKITFEIDHIDGDRTNNDLTNLKVLCPNCHSQTDTFRGKNTLKRT